MLFHLINFLTIQFKDYYRRFTFIPPYLLFLAWISALFSYKNLPILSSYSSEVIILIFTSSWIANTILSIDNQTKIDLYNIHFHSKIYYTVGKIIFSFLAIFPLILFSILLPIILKSFDKNIDSTNWILIIEGHIVGAIIGILIVFFIRYSPFINGKLQWLIIALIIIISLLKSTLPLHIEYLNWILWLFPPIFEILSFYSKGDNVSLQEVHFFSLNIYIILYLFVSLALLILLSKKTR